MKIDKGTSLVRQGEKGSDVYLILDGVLRIDVTANGWRSTARALLGERAHLKTDCARHRSWRYNSRVASVPVNHWTARHSSSSLRDTAEDASAANPVRVHFLGVRVRRRAG